MSKIAGPDASAPKKSRQKRGRPLLADESVGRDALIEVTRQILLTTPPGEVTRLLVANAAGVDPGLIRYYFGTVSHLISEVVVDTHRKIELATTEALETSVPQSWLRERLANLVRMFVTNPYHNQLVRHVMYGPSASEEHDEWLVSLKRSIDVSERQINRGVEEGVLRRVDPRMLHIVLMALSEFFGHNGPIVADIFDGKETNESLSERYVDFVSDLLENGLHAR